MMRVAIVLWFAVNCAFSAENRWKTVDEGFRITIPWSWQKKKLDCYDSNCGEYLGANIEFHFDEVFGLGYTDKEAQETIADLKRKKADSNSLKRGEEVWEVRGRIAHFWTGNVDPKEFGRREFPKVATLHIPYDGLWGYLAMFVFYRRDEDMATIRRVFMSVERALEKPNKAPEPTTTAVTSPAAQEPRQP